MSRQLQTRGLEYRKRLLPNTLGMIASRLKFLFLIRCIFRGEANDSGYTQPTSWPPSTKEVIAMPDEDALTPEDCIEVRYIVSGE